MAIGLCGRCSNTSHTKGGPSLGRGLEGGGLFLEGDLNRGGGVIIFEGGCVFTKNVANKTALLNRFNYEGGPYG